MPDKKYILLFEDGEFRTTDKVSEDDFNSADDGHIDIIRLCDLHRYICAGSWERIKSV